jgi:hypothetical protein
MANKLKVGDILVKIIAPSLVLHIVTRLSVTVDGIGLSTGFIASYNQLQHD